METKLLITDDGSHTLYSKRVDESYHSIHGAIQESNHIFINAGLNSFSKGSAHKINILEIGIGTGLNVLLSYLWARENNVEIEYHGFEPYPISASKALLLNYPQLLSLDPKIFMEIHSNRKSKTKLASNFTFSFIEEYIENANLPTDYFNVVFFDAFSPEAQPEMWSKEIFSSIHSSMVKEGILTTYSCKGDVKRALKSAGFLIEK